MKTLLLQISGVASTDPLFHFILDFLLIGFAFALLLSVFGFILRLFKFR